MVFLGRTSRMRNFQFQKDLRVRETQRARVNQGVRSNHTYLEDHPRTSKWLVTPIYKTFSPFGRGITRSLGDMRSPWLLTTYKSWDDPPSSNHPWNWCHIKKNTNFRKEKGANLSAGEFWCSVSVNWRIPTETPGDFWWRGLFWCSLVLPWTGRTSVLLG